MLLCLFFPHGKPRFGGCEVGGATRAPPACADLDLGTERGWRLRGVLLDGWVGREQGAGIPVDGSVYEPSLGDGSFVCLPVLEHDWTPTLCVGIVRNHPESCLLDFPFPCQNGTTQ